MGKEQYEANSFYTGSADKSSDATPSIEDLQPRNRSKSLQFPATKATVLPSVEEQPDTPTDTPTAISTDASAQTTINGDTQIHERLDKMERILQQLPIQSINEAIEMQKLMLPFIYDGIFGEWDKVDPDHHSDKRAQAKRTGLLMLAKYMTEWKDGFKESYGQKIDGLDCAGKLFHFYSLRLLFAKQYFQDWQRLVVVLRFDAASRSRLH